MGHVLLHRSKCARSYIAGDDDQTIYTFQGADPNIFIDLKGRLIHRYNHVEFLERYIN